MLAEIVERLAALPVAERSGVPGIKPARADVILAGAVVVLAVLEAGGLQTLEVTGAGLREGIFFERQLAPAPSGPGAPTSVPAIEDSPSGAASPAQVGSASSGAASPAQEGPASSGAAEKGEPPLFEDVRRASVLNLAARYHMDVAHTRHVAALALGMFDQLARLGLHEGEPRERELLWAACVLHDIGMSVDYDAHHKHSRYLILNGGLPGFSPGEVAIIAQAARYHRKGMPEPGPLGALFSEEDRARLDRCAVLLRLAEDLERSRDQLVRDTVLTARNGDVELRLLADGESAVPRWAAGRESELFARAFHRGLAVVA